MDLKWRRQIHPFHIVNPSPWPLLTAMSVLFTLFGFVLFMHFYQKGLFFFVFGLLTLITCALLWIKDVVREATFEGDHTSLVRRGLRMGFVYFILSELMLFIAFFWGFFHFSLNPAAELGFIWPPKGIEPLNPFNIPLLNTYILVTSGAFVTWAHYSVLAGFRRQAITALIYTIILAVIFTLCQYYEYRNASFNISDSVYGSTFYMITGFHGAHVIIGTILLIGSLVRLVKHHYTKQQHVGFEAAIWYWHFVDVIWIFVFLFVYWWAFPTEML